MYITESKHDEDINRYKRTKLGHKLSNLGHLHNSYYELC